MPIDPRTPVIIGGGQILQRVSDLESAREPIDLMVEAVRAAAADAGLADVPAPDSIRVVSLLSWRYRDPARLIAEDLGCSPSETAYTEAGGNTPQALVTDTAAAIQAGDLDVAILAGGECWRTRMRARRTEAELPWRRQGDDVEPTRMLGTPLDMTHPNERARGLFMPIQLYPVFESAVRAAAGEGVDDHQVKISNLWADFSKVASTNPNAWVQQALSAEEIRTPGPDNRMVGFPYPKRMNSNNDVDMAAALIMCSAERARALGVPEDRWVFPHAGVDCHDHEFVSYRENLHSSPAVRLGGQRVLELAGIGIDDIEIVDLYSCFPSAVQIGAAALGLDTDRQLTRTGGLCFAGGPWNNYVMHAIATVVKDLRERPGSYGLVWANGGYVTKHGLGVYATTPPAAGFRHDHDDLQAAVAATPRRRFAEPEDAAGPATIEGYTVMHSRDGTPETAIAACLLADGRRAWGMSDDVGLAAAMCEGEWVGTAVELDADGTLLKN